MAAPWNVSDELWARIELLLPVRPTSRTGPKPLPDRQVLQGVLFVLFTGIGWEDLPQELGFGSGMTCWRRLRNWQDAGVFDQLHELLLAELNAAGQIDWSRACVDASHIRAKGGLSDRAEPRRPGQDRLETPPDLRGRRSPSRHGADRWQPQRRHPAHSARRRGCARPRPPEPPTPPTRGHRGRPRLRSRQIPRPTAPARDSATDQPSRHPGHQPTRAVGRRANPRAAAPVPAPGRTLTTPHRHPPRLPRPGLRTHHLAPTRVR